MLLGPQSWRKTRRSSRFSSCRPREARSAQGRSSGRERCYRAHSYLVQGQLHLHFFVLAREGYVSTCAGNSSQQSGGQEGEEKGGRGNLSCDSPSSSPLRARHALLGSQTDSHSFSSSPRATFDPPTSSNSSTGYLKLTRCFFSPSLSPLPPTSPPSKLVAQPSTQNSFSTRNPRPTTSRLFQQRSSPPSVTYLLDQTRTSRSSSREFPFDGGRSSSTTQRSGRD